MARFFLHPFPAFKAGFLFSVGIYLGELFSPDPLAIIAIISLLLPGVLFSVTLSKTYSRDVFLIPVLVCVAAGMAGIGIARRTAPTLPERFLTEELVLVGVVASPSQKIGSRTRFVLENSIVVTDSGVLPFRADILVSLKRKDLRKKLEYGNRVSLRGSLKRPSRPGNPGEFDQRRYYEANGISWIFRSTGPDAILVHEGVYGGWFMRDVVIPARTYALEEIDRSIGGQEGEYLKGVLIGERGGLTPEVKDAFTAAGVAHILAVSGSNVAVVAAFAFFALELFRLNRASRVIVASVFVLFYMMVVGYQPPVVRATIMALVFLLGGIFEEKPNPINSLGVSSLVILGMEPRQLFDVGFQLSFLAVFSIIYLYPIADARLKRLPHTRFPGQAVLWALRVCAVSLVATLGTLPLTAGYFGRVSIIGLLANIVVIPSASLSLLLGFVAVPLSLASQWAADIYAALNQLVLSLTLDLTVAAGNLSFASLDTPRFTAVDSLPFYAVLALIFHFNQRDLRPALIVSLLVTLNLWIYIPDGPAYASKEGKLRISFINVGQGDASLVEVPDGRTMLVDAGPIGFSFDAGERVVVPFLKRRGVSRIDLVVVTHPHSDHMGGVPAVLDAFDVEAVADCGIEAESALYHRYVERVRMEGTTCIPLKQGEIVEKEWPVRIYVLSPPGGLTPSNLNNGSVVIKLVYGNASVLLTGDAERESERRMVDRYGDFLQSDLLKVGHHGSRTSSTRAFMDAVRPELAVISVGAFNRYRHPSEKTIRLLREEEIEVYRTDRDGAVIFESDGEVWDRIEWRGGN